MQYPLDGAPCWADLSSPDLDAAKAFYASLLDWTFDDPDVDFGGHVIASIGQASVAGLGSARAEVPTGWRVFFYSRNADRAGEAIGEAGGKQLSPPMVVRSLGRSLLATDPEGAVFGIWEGVDHHGADLMDAPGALTAPVLASAHGAASLVFYRDAINTPDGLLSTTRAEMVGQGATATTKWKVCFGVRNLETAIAAAKKAGGSLSNPRSDSGNGRRVDLIDPAGSPFSIMEVRSSDTKP
jgi:predicted enzyme related to lactoylglutathione lyase